MKIFSPAVIAVSLFLALSAEARAATIMKLDIGNTGKDVALSSGIFGTVNDGVAATTGDQETIVDYVGPLTFLGDILSGASFSLAGVALLGPPTEVSSVVTQVTTGGSFGVWDSANSLLLSGVLGLGSISGSTLSSTGSFFSADAFSYTGGSLLSLIDATPAGFSLALSQIFSLDSTTGLVVLGCETPNSITCNIQLGDFTANANGMLEGRSTVPEPTSMLLMFSGLVGGLIARRKFAA